MTGYCLNWKIPMTNKKNNDEVIGFRDFIEHENQKKHSGKSPKRQNDFELLTFLDQESRRLSKQIDLFEEKVYIIKNFPQDVELLRKKEVELSAKKEKIVRLLQRKDSPLIKHLAEIFKSYF